MHPTLAALRDQLVQLKKKVEGTVPNDEPIGVAHGNWSFAPVSSPLHEFVSSPVVKEAIRLAPDFLGKITGLAREIVAKPKAEPITVTSSLTEGERPAR